MQKPNTDSEYLQVLKPNLKAAMFSSSIGDIIIALIASAVIGFLSTLIVGIIIFPLTVAGLTVFSYFNVKSREYRFKNDQLEWYEGFLNISQRNIAYNRVTDISLQKPLMQRFFGTGTILVNTAGTDTHEVRMSYIDNPDQEYEKVKTITGN
jgi:uncharacterized membrane protein YdbT with pleckstrin-like domain